MNFGRSSIACLLFTLCAFPQERLDPKLLQEDFRILRSALEEGHSGIYRYTPKPDLDRAFDRALQKLDHSMDALEFFRIAAPAVATVKCGHTSIAPPQTLTKELNTNLPLFPFDVRVLDGKVFVFRDYATEGAKLAGVEIRSINGVPIDRVLSTMTAAAPGDGNVPTSRAWRIGRGPAFSRMLYTLMGIRSPFTVVYRVEPDVREQTLELAGKTLPVRQELSAARYPQDQRPDRAADFKFLDDGKIAVLTIYGFGGSAGDPKKPLGHFLNDAFEQIHERGSRSLIIDVRNNGGGADELGKQLFAFLWDQPFRYYDDLVINARTFSFAKYTRKLEDIPADEVERRADGKFHNIKHPNWGIQQPGKPHFAGKVFILINGGSFSTTCEFTSTVHFHKRAIFIGEEAGGGYYGNTSGYGTAVTLPNSKLVLNLPFQTYYLAVSGYKQADRSVMPDYPVHYTIRELLAGEDKDMAVALKLARE